MDYFEYFCNNSIDVLQFLLQIRKYQARFTISKFYKFAANKFCNFTVYTVMTTVYTVLTTAYTVMTTVYTVMTTVYTEIEVTSS